MTNALGVEVKLAGRFKLTAVSIDEQGVEHHRPLTGWFHNLILDSGLNALATAFNSGYLISTCVVGTSNVPPTVKDTALNAQIASTSTLQVNKTSGIVVGPPRYGWNRRTFRFAQGAAAGNLSEIGIVGQNGVMWSRALILDTGGTPTTITVLANEFLDVVYEARNYIPTGDVVSTIDISGTSYTVTTRPAYNNWVGCWCDSLGLMAPYGAGQQSIYAHDGVIGNESSAPAGTTNLGSVSYSVYTLDSFQLKLHVVWDIGVANFATFIKAVSFQNGPYSFAMHCYQFGFSPSIPKDNTKRLTLNFTLSWGRY